MALIKCEECKKEISDLAKSCPNCGFVIAKKKTCKECNTENEEFAKTCVKCGAPLKKVRKLKNVKIDISSILVKIKQHKKFISIIGIVTIIFISITFGIFAILSNNQKKAQEEQEKYDNTAIKVDISMTSYYGTLEYILYELGLDFNLVTMGANCYVGNQKNEFKTEKFGILYTKYRYCKSNSTLIFRVYNKESDQPLREPKNGELPTFDKYGIKEQEKNNSL